ncbi:MAG: hypothetical protein L3J67_12540 [Hyphomicrobiaceae bacterium]|nr:hypothetical protein [Hyphomicrobiaceae bacterium]
MYELFAMNNAGTEILISKDVERSQMASTMKMIVEAGMTPVAKRINASASTITQNALAFYL